MPFMDYPMVEFMMTVPDHLKYHKKRDRILLRDYMRRRMPDVQDMGQGSTLFPLEKYMSARPLRDMIETCLSEDAVKRRGLFQPAEVRNLLTRSRTGDMVTARQVFGLLTLELWFRIYVDRERGWITS
jgi:asparagine synthase (glutamine-hydrolysing)